MIDSSENTAASVPIHTRSCDANFKRIPFLNHTTFHESLSNHLSQSAVNSRKRLHRLVQSHGQLCDFKAQMPQGPGISRRRTVLQPSPRIQSVQIRRLHPKQQLPAFHGLPHQAAMIQIELHQQEPKARLSSEPFRRNPLRRAPQHQIRHVHRTAKPLVREAVAQLNVVSRTVEVYLNFSSHFSALATISFSICSADALLFALTEM